MIQQIKNLLAPYYACLWRDQMIPAQVSTLRNLAEKSARDGMCILEIGSWCGCSSAILGRVARAHDGRLVCVDWWRGLMGERAVWLERLTDPYRQFRKRVMAEGLEDTVISMRGRSEKVLPLLAEKSFDFIFIDADHRYARALCDMQYARRLIRPGGTICGHDCETIPTPENKQDLERNRNQDFVDGVHAGVVLAVYDAFGADGYEIENSIWFTKSNHL